MKLTPKKTYLVFCFFLMLCYKSKAQEFFLLEGSSTIYKSNATTCTNVRLGSCGSAADIAYYKDTLYSIVGGQLYRTLVSNPNSCIYVAQVGTSITSLTADSTGTVYAAGDNGIYTYKSSTGKVTHLGKLPSGIYPAGDLSFYKGKLYLAAYIGLTSYLVEVNIQQPSLSTIFMKLVAKSVYGCITLPKGCDVVGFYITGQENSSSYLEEIDMENRVELPIKCTYPFSVWGAASYTESGVSNKPEIDTVVTTPACSNNQNSGSIKVSSRLTGSLLTYNLNNSTSNKTGLFTGLIAGTYTITITSEQGCVTDTTVTITSADAPSISTVGVNPSCKNNDGKIATQSLTPGMNLRYSLDGNTYQAIDTFRNISAGNYRVSAINESGCIVVNNVTLSLPTIDTTGFEITLNHSTCTLNNGTLMAVAPSAVKPLTFSINNTTSSIDGSFKNLFPDLYKLSIVDANSCRLDTTIAIKTTPKPIIDSIVTPVLCANEGANGRLNIYGKKTLETLTYSLNNQYLNKTGFFSQLAEGSYKINVSNQYQCSVDTTVNITSTAMPVFSITKTDPTCKGDDGVVLLDSSSQSSNILYSLNGGSYVSTKQFTNLSAGNYLINGKNTSGCITENAFTLIPASMNVKGISISSTNPLCSGNDGRIQVNVQNIKEPVLYTLNGKVSATGGFNNLNEGVYQLKVTDGNWCSFDTTISLVTNVKPIIDSIGYKPNCTGDISNGAINVFTKRTTEVLTYALNNTVTNSSGKFSNLSAGAYAIKISNQFKCFTDTIVNVEAITSPSFRATVIGPSCAGNDGKVVVVPAGSAVKFSLNGAQFNTVDTFKNLVSSTYKIVARNEAGCETEKAVVLTLPAINKGGISITKQNTTCNLPNGAIDISVQNVVTPIAFKLDGATSNIGSFRNLNASSYKLSVIDGNGCNYDTTLTLDASQVIKPQTEIVKINPSCPSAFDGSIVLKITGSQGAYKVSINNSLFTSNYRYQNLDQGSYKFIIENKDQCFVDTFSAQLSLPANPNCSSLYFPNAFTPNGDRKNDCFIPTVFGVLDEYLLSVFTRTGKKVFETKDPRKGWDGTIEGVKQNMSTFVWFSTYKFHGASAEKVMKGTIVLIR
jgi:gliding motility-associated-like protein